jgi:hypothetical protein
MQSPKSFLAAAVSAVAFLFVTAVLSPISAMAINIATCNPTFVANVPGGNYVVVANLVPLANQNCIVVTAPGVTINLNGHTLTGAGGAPGVGILIQPTAAGAHILGGLAISAFSFGIVDLANSALLEGLTVNANVNDGVLMQAVDGSVLDSSSLTGNGGSGAHLLNTKDCIVKYNTAIFGNKVYGVWIQGAVAGGSLDNIVAANSFVPAGVVNPQLAGVWVGANPGAPLGCGGAAPASTGNIIVANTNVNNNTVVGIGLQCVSATNNTVTDNHALGNVVWDVFDGNPVCDANSWVADVFGLGKNNQACVK